MVNIGFLGVCWIKFKQPASLPTIGNPPTEVTPLVTQVDTAITWRGRQRGVRFTDELAGSDIRFVVQNDADRMSLGSPPTDSIVGFRGKLLVVVTTSQMFGVFHKLFLTHALLGYLLITVHGVPILLETAIYFIIHPPSNTGLPGSLLEINDHPMKEHGLWVSCAAQFKIRVNTR